MANKWCLTVVLAALALAPVRADVTTVHTMSMEGGAASMIAQDQLPKITLRIKGTRSRSDIESMGRTMATIVDLAQKQIITLMPQMKTASIVTPASVASGGAPIVVPEMDVALKATGKSQTIDGVACDEHTLSMTIDMASLSGAGQIPPEAAAMLKDVKMGLHGSVWVARSVKGAEEYVAFTKAAMGSNLLTAVSGMEPGKSGGLDKLIAAAATAPGIPYLTEMTMSFEGTGPVVDAMKQAGPMKMIQKLTSISTDAIPDDMFTIPEGYTTDKK